MKGRYESFAQNHLDVGTRSGNEVMVRCVFHDNPNSRSMQFNVEKGLWNCFSCGEGGGIKKLSRRLGIRIAEEPGAELNTLIGKLNSLRSQSTGEVQLTVLPEDHLTRYDFPTLYWGPCSDDRRKPTGCTKSEGCKFHRWLTPETIDVFDLGYDPMENAAIIPIRNFSGGLIGVIKRYLDPDVEFRYRYPKGFKRSTAFFGSWLVDHDPSDTVVLVEGSIDAIKVQQAGHMAVAQYGSSITPEQVRLLLKMGVQRIVQMYDNDKAGRKAAEQSLGIRQHLRNGKMIEEYTDRTDLRRHFSVSRVEWERGDSDPGSLSSEDIRWLIEHAAPV